jgi:hypothetical protein
MSKVEVRYLVGAAGPEGSVINAGDSVKVEADEAKRLLESGAVEAVGKAPAKRAETRKK